MTDYRIARDRLEHPEVLALLQLHLDEMHRWSPACSVHALPAERLRDPEVAFFAARDGDALAAVGALKELDPQRGELKSMRAAPAYRGKGAGEAILLHLLAEARARGYRWLGLETGRPEPFLPAARLYARHGFAECPPFGDCLGRIQPVHGDVAVTIDRRALLGSALALAAGACVPIERDRAGRFGALLRILEASANGVLGVGVLDTATGRLWGHNDYARFPHLSSFKLSLAALVLQLDATGEIDAGERATWTRADLLDYAPFAKERLAQGASLRELAEAAQKLSDNTAANVLLERLGGPERLTAFWRSLGDETSRLDRTEPALNEVPPGEIMDTTTPAAMARTLGKLLYGDALAEAARTTLKQWMAETRTGTRRVRAGLPPEWPAGDKTGTSLWPGMGSVYVDVGYVEPPGRAPLTFAAYFRAAQQHTVADPDAEAVLADVGRIIARYAGRG